jgi:hypothetical protein
VSPEIFISSSLGSNLDRSTTTPVQRIITAEKGIALDFASLSRDTQFQSKELYMWGQKEHSDVKDSQYSDSIFLFVLIVLSQSPTGWVS